MSSASSIRAVKFAQPGGIGPIASVLVVTVSLALGYAVVAGGGAGLSTIGWVLLLSILPFLFHLSERWPVETLGLYCAVQWMEAFETATPLGTVSPGIVVLGILALVSWRNFKERYSKSTVVRYATISLIAWYACFALRLSYQPPNTVFREMITNASFLVIFMVGVSIAGKPGVLRSVAIGSTISLLVLGVSGTLAGVGILPLPVVTESARTLFGFTSPIARNFGLSMPIDAIALLLPLCMPYWLVRAFASRDRRAVPLMMVLVLSATVILVFQARGMALQILIGFVTIAFFRARILRPVIAVLAIPAFGYALMRLISLDALSSGLRAETARLAIQQIGNSPLAFVVGHDENPIFVHAAANLGYLSAIGQDNRIHNFFLSTLYGSGWIAFLAVGFAYLGALLVAFRKWLSDTANFNWRVLLLAVVSVFVALAVEGVRANIVGSWLILGLVIGFAGTQIKDLVQSASAVETNDEPTSQFARTSSWSAPV